MTKNLMIVAHPDDESIFGGHLFRKHNNWRVICVTNGNNATRSNEFKNVMKITNSQYKMWNFKDHIKYNFGSKQEQLKDMLKRELNSNYNMIVTHNLEGEYGHPQHKLLSEIVTNLVKDKSKLYYFDLTENGKKLAKIPQHTPSIYNNEITTDITLTEEDILYKKKLLTCYNSQSNVIKHPEIYIYIEESIISNA